MQASHQHDFTGIEEDVAITTLGSNLQWHQLSWVILQGTLGDCRAGLQQSTDGVNWTDLIPPQSANGTGQSAVFKTLPNYIRLRTTRFAPQGGTPTLSTLWTGWDYDPTTGSLPPPPAPEPAGTVYSGPTSGGNATPTFRSLVNTDIPNINESQVNNLVTDLSTRAPLANPAFSGIPTAPTPPVTDNGTRLATTSFVQSAIAVGAPPSPQSPSTFYAGPVSGGFAVPTFRGIVSTDVPPIPESGVIGLSADLAAKAPLASPSFTGTPSGTTATLGDSTTRLATTAFVQAALTGSGLGTVTSVGLAAPAEFNVTGSPVTGSGTLTLTKAAEAANSVWAAPNGAAGLPTFRLLVAADIPNISESQVTGLVGDLAAKAPLASPALTGTPTAPTPSTADNSTTVATTAYVKSNLSSYAPLASPALTGTPTAPTAAVTDNSTTLATTAFVKGGYRLKRIFTLTSSQTYTLTSDIRALYVEAIGGGGGSGALPATSSNASVSGGGGSGGYSASWLTSPAASYTVTIGGGGAAGTSGGAGGNGGATSFGSNPIANGGGGGAAGTAAGTTAASSNGGAAATAGTGDISLGGMAGHDGVVVSGTLAANGGGAPGPWGGGTPIFWRASSVAGAVTGLGFGSGGGGLVFSTTHAALSGSLGAGGAVRIWEFI